MIQLPVCKLGRFTILTNFLISNLFFPVDGSGLQSVHSKSNPCAWHILGSWTTARNCKDVGHVRTSWEWALLGKLQPSVSFICYLVSLERQCESSQQPSNRWRNREDSGLEIVTRLYSFIALFLFLGKNKYRGIPIFQASERRENWFKKSVS